MCIRHNRFLPHNFLKNNKGYHDNFILITFDVKSLYTNIPNDHGIQACVDMLNENNIITSELKQSVIEILSLILNKNSFAFNNEHFLQIHGTAMGSSMAPTYGNIFMAIWNGSFSTKHHRVLYQLNG